MFILMPELMKYSREIIFQKNFFFVQMPQSLNHFNSLFCPLYLKYFFALHFYCYRLFFFHSSGVLKKYRHVHYYFPSFVCLDVSKITMGNNGSQKNEKKNSNNALKFEKKTYLLKIIITSGRSIKIIIKKYSRGVKKNKKLRKK